MSSEALDPVEMHNAVVLAELRAESSEMKKARSTMGKFSQMEREYQILKAKLFKLGVELKRESQFLAVQLDLVANRHPDEAERNGWVGYWRKIGCPWYSEHDASEL